ncbi:hypothetical protein GCM10028798_28870 [Humibacter antri]
MAAHVFRAKAGALVMKSNNERDRLVSEPGEARIGPVELGLPQTQPIDISALIARESDQRD